MNRNLLRLNSVLADLVQCVMAAPSVAPSAKRVTMLCNLPTTNCRTVTAVDKSFIVETTYELGDHLSSADYEKFHHQVAAGIAGLIKRWRL